MVRLPEPEKGESNLLKGTDLKKTVNPAKIKAVTFSTALRNQFINMDGKDVTPVLELDGQLPKTNLALNKTNYRTLLAKLGDDSDGWTGKKITLIRVTVNNPQTNQSTHGIRVEVD